MIDGVEWVEDGERVLDILARHPSTARFISRELAQRFVADDPPPQGLSKIETIRKLLVPKD